MKEEKIFRGKFIQIRATEVEREIIQEHAKKFGNTTASEWLRSFGLSPKDYVGKPLYKEWKQDPDLIRQLAFIGNNINQLSRQINTLKKQGEAIDIIALQLELVEINERLSAITKMKPKPKS